MTFICFFDFAVSGRLHSARYLRFAVCLKLHCAVCASDGRQLEMLQERITYSSATSLSYRARQEPHASPGAFLTLRHALPRLTARLSSVRPGFTWLDLASLSSFAIPDFFSALAFPRLVSRRSRSVNASQLRTCLGVQTPLAANLCTLRFFTAGRRTSRRCRTHLVAAHRRIPLPAPN